MKTQISRNSHRPLRRYSGVYQQQGRMITDADWNELMQVVQGRLQAVLKDIIGTGVPNADKGVRLELDTAASGLVINILAGNLYAQGLSGALLADTVLHAQEDMPHLPLPVLGGGQGYILYADLWDRSVTALEDVGLLDAGLHGADTTTRTQTMVQVKWCPSSLDPEDAGDNPVIGDARLSLTLRTVRELDDECDPCAVEIVQTQEYVGNYLFRVEVHKYTEDSGDRRLVLKWSSENGAEQYVVGSEPVEFTEGAWIYEFFHRDSEKYLGTHYPPATADYPYCPSLREGYPASPGLPAAPAERPWLVRRWDGYCELTKSGTGPWLLVAGKDKVHTLTTDPARSGQDGFVVLTSKLQALLGSKSLELEVELDGSTFVRGDYWLCAVREALHTPGDTLLVDALPEGVRHHYIRLAELQADGTLTRCDNDSDCRRLAFPPLTDLRAGDIGYTVPDCPEVSSDPPTVQSLLRSALSAWPDLDSDKRRTVKDVLDAILCHLDAARLPYNPILQQTRWEDILESSDATTFPRTVQAAIDDLIAKFETSDIWYEHDPDANGNCQATPYGADTVKVALNLDPDHDNKIKLNDILAALLCKLEADKIPYNPTVSTEVEARWADLLEGVTAERPLQLQAAIDKLLLKLESSDIWYEKTDACTKTDYGANTVRVALGLEFNPADKIKLNDILTALLCKLEADKIPYDPTSREADWKDILDDPEAPLPTNVQEAVDDLVGNIEGSDIGYTIPTCTPAGDTSTLKDELDLSGVTDVKEVLDTLLCEFNATDLPVEKNAELAGRLNIPGVVTVQDALNLLSNAGGGGLAAVIAALTDGVAKSGSSEDDDETNVKAIRQQALSLLPVQGADSLLAATAGMVLDVVRFVYTVALECLDVGTLGAVRGSEKLGFSSSINLYALASTEGYAALWRRILDKKDELNAYVGSDLVKIVAHTIMLVLGQRLVGSQATPEEQLDAVLKAIERIKQQAGSTGSWNGALLRDALLTELYGPIIGSKQLDHPAARVLKELVMEVFARLWQRVSHRLCLETLPVLPLPPDDQWFSQAGDLVGLIVKALGGDGLVRNLDSTASYERITDLFVQRDPDGGYGYSWILGRRRTSDGVLESSLMRMRHETVLKAIDNMNTECPMPELNVVPRSDMPTSELKWLSIEDLRISGKSALIKVQTSSGIFHCALPSGELTKLSGDVKIWGDMHTGVSFFDAATLELVHNVPFPVAVVFADLGMSHMVDGLAGGLQLVGHITISADGVVTLRCSNFSPMFTIQGEIRVGATVQIGGLQGVYSLSLNAPAEESHLLVVLDTQDGQMISLLHGVDVNGAVTKSWVDGDHLETLRSIGIIGSPHRILGAAHDQIILEQMQSDGRYWAFVPFRAMHDSLWGEDGDVLGSIIRTYRLGSEPYDRLSSVNRDFEYGGIDDYFAGDDPWITCQPTSNQRYFYRCFAGIFPKLDIVLPGGATGSSLLPSFYLTQTSYSVESAGAKKRLLSVRANHTTVEYHALNLDSGIFGGGD